VPEKRKYLLRDMAVNVLSFRTLQFHSEKQTPPQSSQSSSSSSSAPPPAPEQTTLFGPEILVERLLYGNIPCD